MTQWTVLAAVACLGAGLACLVLAATGTGDRPAQLTHAVMGVAMAAMLAPGGDPLPQWAGIAVFVLLGAWFAAAALRGARGGAVHLAISSSAMVLMYLGHHGGGAMPGMAAGHHAGHPGATGGPAGPLVVALGLLLAGYFVWHTWTCVDRARARPSGPSGSAVPGFTALRSRVRVEPAAHGLMSALMAAMFLGVV